MSNELTTRHRSVMPAWQALYYEEPIELVSGEGRYVVDREGRRYLDFFGGILTTSVGHSIPEVVEAIREQAAKLLHASTLYVAEPMVRLAERIASLSTIPDARVFFTTSGTEANDAALLMATSYRKSNQVLAFRHSYHGRSFTTMAITGNRAWSASSLSGLAVSYVQSGYRLRSPFAKLPDDEYVAACAQDLRDVIDTTTSGDVACMIAEPIQGVGGFATPPDGFFAAMKEVLDRHGILFMSDEVQTGWGRTGEHFWGFQAHGIVPDMITFAKGIANGLPLGGVIARADVMNAIHANSISTFGGNPIAVAAADATLSYILDHDLQANALARGEYLRNRLAPVVARCPWIAELRGKGLMLALETVVPGSIDPDAAAVAALHEACKRRGLLIGKGGLYGNVLRIAPPLSVTQHEVEEAADILLAAIDDVEAARCA